MNIKINDYILFKLDSLKSYHHGNVFLYKCIEINDEAYFFPEEAYIGYCHPEEILAVFKSKKSIPNLYYLILNHSEK